MARSFGGLTAVLAVMLAISACGGQAPSGAAHASTAAPAAPASAAPPSPAASAAAASAPAPSHLTKLIFGVPQLNLNYIVPIAAKAKGYFKQEGLDVQIVPQKPDASVAAMLRGDEQVTGAGGSALRAALRGAPFTAVAFLTEQPNYYLVSQPGITSITQLVGKKVGVTTVGDTLTIATRLFAEQKGVNPAKIAFISMGPSEATRVAAMEHHALDAMVTDSAGAVLAQSLGFHVIPGLSAALPDPQQGLVTTTTFVQQHPATLRAFLKAMVMGLRLAKQDPQAVAQVARTALGLKMSQSQALEAVKLYADGISAAAPGYAGTKHMAAFYRYEIDPYMPKGKKVPVLDDFSVLLQAYGQLGIARPT